MTHPDKRSPDTPAGPATPDEIRSATLVRQRLAADRGLLAQLPTEERRRVDREERVLSGIGIRAMRRQTAFTTPNIFPPSEFTQEDVADDTTAKAAEVPPKHCYVCKRLYDTLHHFYDQPCPTCAAFNFAKRSELADPTGRVALLTGGRVKIGYQAGIKLLRGGAHLIVTTRFPPDAALRFAAEPDFAEWEHRLEIFGLDLRHTPSVEGVCRELLDSHDRPDFIVDNACQTVRRPPEFYAHMMAMEQAAAAQELPEVTGLTHAAQLSQLAPLPEDRQGQGHFFPEGRLDQDLRQVDLRDRNPWRMCPRWNCSRCTWSTP